MHYRDDVSPWDRVPAIRQEASDYTTRPAGTTPDDRSPWYVGDRYFSNAFLAERVREREKVVAREAAERRARWDARQRGEG